MSALPPKAHITSAESIGRRWAPNSH